MFKIFSIKQVNINKIAEYLLIFLMFVFAAFLIYFSRPLLVAALVNGKPVSRLSVVQELEKQAGSEVLENLIDRQLILQEAEKKGVKVSKEEINKEIARIEDMLKEQNLSLDQALKIQRQTRESLNEQIKIQKIVEILLKEQVAISDEEVKKYYDENKELYGQSKFEEVKDRVREEMVRQKLSTEYTTWIASLRKEAKINYFISF